MFEMGAASLLEKGQKYLPTLCEEIPFRSLGSEGNILIEISVELLIQKLNDHG